MALPKLKNKISLLKKIDSYLRKAANPKYSNDWKPKPRIKPSDLGSPCYRKIYYSYLRIPRDFPLKAKEKKIFDTGDAYHEMIESWVKGTGCLIEYKDPKTGLVPKDRWKPDKLNSEFPIAVPALEIKMGKIDAVLKINGQLWLGEWKSMKSEKHQKLEEPVDSHRIQANTYVQFFEYCRAQGMYDHIEELEDLGEVQGVIFLYVNKDNTEVKEYVVQKEDSDLEEIVAKVAKVKKYVEDKELPEKTDDYCFFCPWNKSCQKNYNPLDNDDSES